MPAAARNWNAPFPVSPSGGKPGRAGSPHAGSTLRGQPKALARIVRRLPPQEGCRPLVDPLRVVHDRAWQFAGHPGGTETRVGRNRPPLENRLHKILDATINRRERSAYAYHEK